MTEGNAGDQRPDRSDGTFSVVADHERMSPRETMKKKGPQRSQSRSALPESSRNGLGKTTSLRLLTTRLRSRLMVSQTGSVSVLAPLVGSGPPNPSGEMGTETATMVPEAGVENGAAAAVENGSLAAVVAGGSAEDEETGMEARGGEEMGRAAGTMVTCWEGQARARVSISSMSDRAVEGCRACDMAGGGWISGAGVARSRSRVQNCRRLAALGVGLGGERRAEAGTHGAPWD